MPDEEKSRELTRSSYAAQMAMLGYEPDGTHKDMVEVVRCKDCKHRPKEPNLETFESGFDIEFPEGSKCPCQCSGDEYYSWYPEDDWFCADGERRDKYGKEYKDRIHL